MTAVARAELVIAHPVSKVFTALTDYRSWRSWMPSVFKPVFGPSRPLAVGDRMFVLIGGALPTMLQVVRLEPNREITWSGGLPGVLVGTHAFYFEDAGDGRTRVISEEPFSGVLAGPLRGVIRSVGSKGAADMLQGLARFIG